MLARALILALLWAGTAAAEVAVPALRARVTDQTGTLDAGEQAALEARLESFERAKGSQVAVLIVRTTQPEAIEQFAIRVADAWKIGRGGNIDDGVILLVAKEDRAVRIEVGYGLEGALPDAIAKRIIEETIVPRFRAGDFYGGISEGVEQIIGVIEGEPLPPPPERPADGVVGPSVERLWLILFVPLVLGAAVRQLHNRLSGGIVAGGLGAALGWWATRLTPVALGFALLCGFLILASNGGRGGRWSSRGGSWGGGGFSGGGGGFSGGGGGFGGGGASGRW